MTRQFTLRPLLLLLLLTYSYALHAINLRGRILDTDGQPVPFASIHISGTERGTAANAEGRYTLTVEPGTITLVVRMIGYKPTYKQLQITPDIGNVDLILAQESQELSEVTVRANGPDPADAIMRQVIAHKAIHARAVRTMETDIYLKGKLYMRDLPRSILGVRISDTDRVAMQKELGLDSNNQGIIYLLEQLTHYTFEAPNHSYSEVRAVKTSGDPKGLGFATMPPIVNIYENNVSLLKGIGSRGFISPAHNNAFFYYRFRLLQSYMDKGQMIHKIEVIPKRTYEPLFRGVVYVAEQDWNFQQVRLALDKRAQIETLDSLTLEQQYRKTTQGTWVIQQQVLYPVLTIMGIKIAGDFVTNYQNQQVNQPIDRSVFHRKIISSYEQEALSRDTAYWANHRPLELLPEETGNYRYQDSMYRNVRQAREQGATQKGQKQLSAGAFSLRGPYVRKGKHQFGMSGLLQGIGFNTVEGLYTQLAPYWQYHSRTGTTLRVTSTNRYGWANKSYQWLLQTAFEHADTSHSDKGWKINLQGGQYVYQLNGSEPISPLWNSVVSLLYGANYLKLYRASGAGLTMSRTWGNGWSAELNLQYVRRAALYNHSDYTFNNQRTGYYTPNNPLNLPAFENHKAALASLSVHYQPGWRYIQYPNRKVAIKGNAPVFSLEYTKGLPDIAGSKSDFDRWRFSLQHQHSLKLLGQLDYKLHTGGFLNKRYVGNPDLYHLNGNQTFLAAQYMSSFQLAPYYRYSSAPKWYAEAHAEWHLNGWLTNKIPLFKRLNWHLVASGNLMYVNPDIYYAEYAIGLENIGIKFFKLLRVDLVSGYGSMQQQPTWGLRIGAAGLISSSGKR